MVLLPTFDPRTAYQHDYQYLPLLEAVTWERRVDGGTETVTGLQARFDAAAIPDIVSTGGGIGFTKQGPCYVALWQPRPDGVEEDDWSMVLVISPAVGDTLIREEALDDAGFAQRWLITQVTPRPFKGQFELLCDREIANA